MSGIDSSTWAQAGPAPDALPTSTAIRVMIVDDQSIIRAGLRRMLELEPDIVVTADAADGAAAVELAATEHPDVVLMDVRMPQLDGIEATRRILAARSAGAVVILTTFDDEDYLLDGVRAGAAGFLLKDAGADLIAAAVRVARRGDTLIDPAMTRSLIEHRMRAPRAPELGEEGRRRLALLETLSERERSILHAVARGLSNAEIARAAFLSEATVKTHLSSILAKTGLRSRLQAAVFAYETRFVQPGDGEAASGMRGARPSSSLEP